jgi:hypothetical protein
MRVKMWRKDSKENPEKERDFRIEYGWAGSKDLELSNTG